MPASEYAVDAFLHDEMKIAAYGLPTVGVSQPRFEHLEFDLDFDSILNLLQAFELLKDACEMIPRIRIMTLRTLENSRQWFCKF